jgi:hypothetical protein
MKQCPNCKTTYTDESLRFCLADGASLIRLPNAEETLRMNFDKNALRTNAPPDSTAAIFPPLNTNREIRKGVSPSIVIALVGLLLLAVLGLVGVVGYFSFGASEKKQIAAVLPTPGATAAPTFTPNDETVNLKEKLANLEKQVQAQKNQKQIVIERNSQVQPQTENIRRVNSPNDGFLALRNAPNSETGEQLAKIPHGASVTVLGCPKPSNVGKMSGRWCRVIYNGQTGWAFDAFLLR